MVSLIQEAIQSGARQQQACEVLELSSRTYQRWIKTGVVSDGRTTTKRPAPLNKLSDDERQQILAVCNTPVYAHLPPYQIVPRLADQGIYLASESSFYRILKAANQLTHRGNIKIKAKSNKVRHFTAARSNQVWSWDITYCAPSLRKLLWKMLSGLEHVWNASRITLEETNWMPALCYGRA